ncbi:MAG TPA: DUF1559 domain-containing protein [Planctomycetaceae bacterium]|nr:DUF1559 domain-containing protein [Planctomycetaceae bacterium]
MNSLEPQFNEVPALRFETDPLSSRPYFRVGCLGGVALLSLALLVLSCFVPGIALSPLLVLLELSLGWVVFLAEQLPRVRPSRAEAVFSLIVVVIFASALHATARGISRLHGRWRMRWTRGLLVVAGLMFATGSAAAGIGRQLVELAQLPQWFRDFEYRGGGRRSQSKNNLKQIGLALHNYHDTFQHFPAARTFDELGRPMHSWTTALLPYIDQFPLSQQIRHDLPWNAPENRTVFQTTLEVLQTPSRTKLRSLTDAGYAVANYAVNVHAMGPNRGISLPEITDGSSNTIAAGEVIANPRAWGDPRNARDPTLGINASPEGFGGPYTGGCHVLLFDGSVRFLSNKADPALLRKLATPNGGETVPELY